MVEKEICTKTEGLAGGKGTARIYHVRTKEQLQNAGRLYARMVLEPGSSVGWHCHNGETEPYYILKGEGVFTDNDGTETIVGPGDICSIENHQYHSIENRSDQDLEFMALIYNLD